MPLLLNAWLAVHPSSGYHQQCSLQRSSHTIAHPLEEPGATSPALASSSVDGSGRLVPTPPATSQPHRSFSSIMRGAGARALGGGLPGAAAMVVQVLSLMWLRTTVQYQYRTGSSARVALATLYAQGGVPRFYQGLGPALLQGPLCRFGDTAANAGVLGLLSEFESTKKLPLGLQTAAASAAAACWRCCLLPLDALKTMQQVEGKGGTQLLWAKVRTGGGPGVLYHGAAASLAASFVGHWPWFTTYNSLNQLLPLPDDLHSKLLRSAAIGFCAGVASDTISNSVRVIKTSRQTARTTTSYRQVVKSIVAQDGVSGLFTRGLTTRIAANALQNVFFTVLWNLGQEQLSGSRFLARLQQQPDTEKQ